jgi:hypothetical protein
MSRKATVALGIQHHRAGRLGEAERCYQSVLRRKGQQIDSNVDVHFMLGSLLVERGEPEAGAAHLEIVVRQAPEFPRGHINLGLALLQLGDFERGWAEYRWRHTQSIVSATGGGASSTAWDGAPLHGRTIVLLPEQGLGDTIQFARYAPLVAARGGRVILGCPLALKRLLRTLDGVSQVASGDDPPVMAHVSAALLDLPDLFETRLSSVPAAVPYLHAEPELVDAWAPRFSTSNFHVGLAWAGNPSHEHDARRSTSLDKLSPLADVPGVQFYSLQKGPGTVSPASTAFRNTLIDLGPDLQDFADTAAALMHMDLVITVDTSVAHLAGALGRPVWLLLSRGHDWRWIDGWDHSPWYPTMRIFRQDIANDWPNLARRVAAALSELRTSPPSP